MTRRLEGRVNDLAAPEFPHDFVDFVHELNAHGVEYVLVGGYALGVHGIVRATSDIDFFYRPSADNVDRLIAALESFGAPENVIDRQHLLRPGNMAAFGTPPTRIDVLSSIEGLTFDEAVVDVVTVDLDGEALPVIGRAALIANKRATGRRKDLGDARRLSAQSDRTSGRRRRS